MEMQVEFVVQLDLAENQFTDGFHLKMNFTFQKKKITLILLSP